MALRANLFRPVRNQLRLRLPVNMGRHLSVISPGVLASAADSNPKEYATSRDANPKEDATLKYANPKEDATSKDASPTGLQSLSWPMLNFGLGALAACAVFTAMLASISADIKRNHSEITTKIDHDIASIRKDINHNHSEVTTKIDHDIASIRKDINHNHSEVITQIAHVKENLETKLGHVKENLDKPASKR